MSSPQTLLLYKESDTQQGQSDLLFKISGLDVAVTISGSDGAVFPYRPGSRCDVRVYNPSEETDVDGDWRKVDGDWRKWYFNFIVTSHQIIDSDIYVIGYSRPDRGFDADISGYLCDEDHQPWQHDGACGATKHYGYSGLVEMRLHFARKPLEPEWEFHQELEALEVPLRILDNAVESEVS